VRRVRRGGCASDQSLRESEETQVFGGSVAGVLAPALGSKLSCVLNLGGAGT